jgi:hypothetical protein
MIDEDLHVLWLGVGRLGVRAENKLQNIETNSVYVVRPVLVVPSMHNYSRYDLVEA